MQEKEVAKILEERRKLKAKYNKISRDYMLRCMDKNTGFIAGSGVLYSTLVDEQFHALDATASTFQAMNDKEGLNNFLELVDGTQKVISEKLAEIKLMALDKKIKIEG